MTGGGGVGRTMGSNGRKGGRKEAQPKRPGPKPTAEPPPKKQFKGDERPSASGCCAR